MVIAIIALLAGITLPALGGAREKAKGSKCASNLKQCITAYISYSGDYKGWGPAALADSSRAWGGTAVSGKKSWGSILVWKGYLTREVLKDLVKALEETAQKKGKHAALSFNPTQSVLFARFLAELPQEEAVAEEANEGEQYSEA